MKMPNYIFLLFLIELMGMLYANTTTITTFNCTEPPLISANFDINTCCRIPEINLGSALDKCHQYVNNLNTSNANLPHYAHVCYPECLYRETGTLINGDIQLENVKYFLQNNIHQRDKDIVPHIIESFGKCIQNIKGHMQSSGIKMYSKLQGSCSPYSSMVYGCVNAETFLHCPQQMWKNEQNCNLAKSFAEQCNPLPHVPLPLS